MNETIKGGLAQRSTYKSFKQYKPQWRKKERKTTRKKATTDEQDTIYIYRIIRIHVFYAGSEQTRGSTATAADVIRTNICNIIYINTMANPK